MQRPDAEDRGAQNGTETHPPTSSPPLAWRALHAELRHARLPLAAVDLDAFDRNAARVVSAVRGTRCRVRIASKSLRHRGLLRRAMTCGGDTFAGVLCYSAEEAAWLSEGGFDDLLVAYPTVQARALDAVAMAVARGATVRCVVDSPDHVAALSEAGARHGVVLEAVLDLDVAFRPLGPLLHVGVRRSPLRTAAQVSALVRASRAWSGVRIVGLMAYEAHVAGVEDRPRGASAMQVAMVRAMKRAAVPAVAAMRAAAIAALEAEGIEVALVNGGGTGSLSSTLHDPSVTEISVGSAFLCPHLFDGHDGPAFEPAAFFALEVTRKPDARHVTCAGGGYVASGAPGPDRLPLPWWPEGLSWVPLEGAGEVQSPLRVARGRRPPDVGDAVLFRHAKAGELAERFDAYAELSAGAPPVLSPTYRGEQQCFL